MADPIILQSGSSDLWDYVLNGVFSGSFVIELSSSNNTSVWFVYDAPPV